MFLPSYHNVLNRSCASAALRLRTFHANAPGLSLPIPPALLSLETKADTASAREWLDAFKVVTVPRNMVELSFARSSGPGGQVCQSPLRHRNIPSVDLPHSTECQQGQHESDSTVSN